LVFGEVIDTDGTRQRGHERHVEAGRPTDWHAAKDTRAPPPTKLKASSSRESSRTPLLAHRQVRISQTQAVTTNSLLAIHCARINRHVPKCNGQWASRNEKEPPRSRPLPVRNQIRLRRSRRRRRPDSLYKLICREVATHGMTPRYAQARVGVNGSGMHTNVSVMKGGKNILWDPKCDDEGQQVRWQFVGPASSPWPNICLGRQPECQRYRQPRSALRSTEQIKASAVDRCDESRLRSARSVADRSKFRSVGSRKPILDGVAESIQAGLDGENGEGSRHLRQADRYLRKHYDALKELREASGLDALRRDVKGRFLRNLKRASADRARAVGDVCEVTGVQFPRSLNHFLWNMF